MGHNASKVLMGMTQSSFRIVDNKKGTREAGLAVRLTSAGALSVTKADGELLGVSVGKDLSEAGRTNICRAGLGVPVLLTSGFTPTVGAQVHIDDATGKAAASGTGKTGVNAVYASGKLTAIKEDGTEDSTDGCALIDMAGGL